jgi:hypothetical protein
VFAFAALAACEPIDLSSIGNSSGPKIDTNAPIPVALLVPVGSGNTGDDVLARSLENAARLAMADLDGVTIDLRVYATAGNPNTAASRAQQAVDDGAKIILGPVYAASANAAGVAVADDGVNVLAFSNNPEIAGGNVFVLGPTFDNSARRLIGYAASKGRSRIVAVHSNDVAGQLGLSAIQRAAAGSSAQVVTSVPYELSQQGVVAAVPRIKSAVDGAGANAVFMTSTTAGALPLFSQLLPEAGVNSQYIGLTRWDIPRATLDLPGLQGGWFALPDPNRTASFNTRYSSTYGQAPHPIGGLAFDGIAAIGALAAQGNRDALTGKALTQGSGFQGATGIFRLRSDGTNDRGLSVATIQGGQVTIVDTAPSSFAGF